MVILQPKQMCGTEAYAECTGKCIEGHICESNAEGEKFCLPKIGVACIDECQTGAICAKATTASPISMCIACSK